MTYDFFNNIFLSAGHFFRSLAFFASGDFGILLVGMLALLMIISFFNALRS